MCQGRRSDHATYVQPCDVMSGCEYVCQDAGQLKDTMKILGESQTRRSVHQLVFYPYAFQSFRAEYAPRVHPASPIMKQTYDTLCKAWRMETSLPARGLEDTVAIRDYDHHHLRSLGSICDRLSAS